jgi:hypothetical protein
MGISGVRIRSFSLPAGERRIQKFLKHDLQIRHKEIQSLYLVFTSSHRTEFAIRFAQGQIPPAVLSQVLGLFIMNNPDV